MNENKNINDKEIKKDMLKYGTLALIVRMQESLKFVKKCEAGSAKFAKQKESILRKLINSIDMKDAFLSIEYMRNLTTKQEIFDYGKTKEMRNIMKLVLLADSVMPKKDRVLDMVKARFEYDIKDGLMTLANAPKAFKDTAPKQLLEAYGSILSVERAFPIIEKLRNCETMDDIINHMETSDMKLFESISTFVNGINLKDVFNVKKN